MNAKRILTISAVVLVTAIYYYLYKDYFTRGTILITVTQRQPNNSRVRTQPGVAAAEMEAEMLVFGLGQDYQLTDIQVVSQTPLPSGKPANPLWHLVSETGSPPTRSFIYGHTVPGMHSFKLAAAAERLEPGTAYRILVEAGPIKGSHDFQTPPENPAAR